MSGAFDIIFCRGSGTNGVGYLVLLVPNETPLFKIIWFLWTRATGRVWKGAHLQQFSLDDLKKILETANLTIVESRHSHLNMLLALKARPTAHFSERNKQFYQTLDYDWAKIADRLVGPETLFHRLRETSFTKFVRREGHGNRYLDAGCGTGLMLRHLPPGTVGLDINPEAVEKARHNAPQATVLVGDLENLPFADNSFSTAVCTEVLEHLPDPQPTLREIKRVLIPGGQLVGSVPRKSLLWKLQFLSRTGPWIPYHRHYNQRELKKQLAAFENTAIKSACLGMQLFFTARKP